MRTIEKTEMKKLDFPISGYNYIVMIIRSVDGGITFANCGCSKYFKTKESAEEYICLHKANKL